MTTYAELRLRIDRGVSRGSYRIVATGPAGEALGRFKLPFSDLELENFILRVGSTRRGRRRVDSPEMELAKNFGSKLFGALFEGDVRELYRSSFAETRGAGQGLRVTLSLTGAPELLQVPWEYLYDHPSFLSISTWTPIVRYLDLPRPRRPLQIDLPLRILALVSAPSDAELIDAQQERSKLEAALAPLIAVGAIAIDWLEEASLRALQRQLRKADYHVFHYIGHGGYDQDADDGVLLFEDEHGRGRRVSGVQLGTILADEVSLRLAVLNSCEGGRSSIQDPFSGVATSLIEREIPAVIGMQFEITDRAAIVFAGEFYSALADGLPVDSSVAEARKAIYADENDIEWGTPVLFMRVADGRLFDVQAHAPVRAALLEAAAGPTVDDAPLEVADAGAEERRRLEREAAEAAERDQMAAEAAEREGAAAAAAEAERAEQDRLQRQREEREADEAAQAERIEQERLRGEAEESSRSAALLAGTWVSEEELVAPPAAGSAPSADQRTPTAAGGATAGFAATAGSRKPVATVAAHATSADSGMQGLPPGLGRAALGGVLTAAFADAWYLTGHFWDLENVVKTFLGYAGLLAVSMVAVVVLAEARLPAVRVPDGSLYRSVGGKRWAAAAIEGVVLGASVGLLATVYHEGSSTYLTLEAAAGLALAGGVGFAVAEAFIDRFLRRGHDESSKI